MVFNVSGGYAAGAGADGLESLWKLLAEKADMEGRRGQEDKRIKIAQQSADDNSAFRRIAQEQQAEARAATMKLQAQQGADKLSSVLAPGSVMDKGGADALRAGDLGSLLEHQQSTLPSTALSGIADAGQSEDFVGPQQPTAGAPSIRGRLMATANAGHGEQDVYKGTGQQQETQRKMILRGRMMNDPNTPDAVRQFIGMEDAGSKPIPELFKDKEGDRAAALADKETTMRLAASLRPPSPGHFSLQPGKGPDGKDAMYRVNAQTGEATIVDPHGGSLGKSGGASATLDNRLQSAKAVVQTGNDIAAALRDPKIATQLGQVMSRYNSVADFVGNAPPEWSNLAGMIESYSLANMGVHGMRSATGAEAIKQTLGQGRHTPESMIAALHGLNGFSNHLLENNGRSADGAAPGAGNGAGTAPKRIRYDLNGNQIKD